MAGTTGLPGGTCSIISFCPTSGGANSSNSREKQRFFQNKSARMSDILQKFF